MTIDEEAIARTIYGEARSLGEEGMRAVACVIMNRVAKKRWWGLTPWEVCHKYAMNKTGKLVYQFDCWDPNDPNCEKCQQVTTADPSFKIASELAEDAMQHNWMDITRGACWYYSGDKMPYWAQGKNPCLVISNTKWYTDIN